jgi:hypothetical protein
MANNNIFTGSFDHYIVVWDFEEMMLRIEEKKLMRLEDIRSRKVETYYRVLN